MYVCMYVLCKLFNQGQVILHGPTTKRSLTTNNVVMILHYKQLGIGVTECFHTVVNYPPDRRGLKLAIFGGQQWGGSGIIMQQ